MSHILDALNLEYKIKDTPKDGNCFYHAVAYQINYLLDANELRHVVANSLLEQDAHLYNIIHEKEFSLSELKERIGKPNIIWADNIEINALCRALPRLRFFILDEQSHTIYKIENIENMSEANTDIFLRRNNEHFESIIFKDQKSYKKVLKKMKCLDFMNIHTNETNSNVLLIISCILPLLIMFKFLYNPLQNR